MTLDEIVKKNTKEFNELPFKARHLSAMTECHHRIVAKEEEKKKLKLECARKCRMIDQDILILQTELLRKEIV